MAELRAQAGTGGVHGAMGLVAALAARRDARRLLFALLAADLLFLLLHLGHVSSVRTPASPMFSLEIERSFPEFFQYGKALALLSLFAAMAARTRVAGYLAWSAVFGYLLVDDSLGVHERAGAAIAARLGFVDAGGLRAQDYGELAVYCVAALATLLLLHGAYRRAPPSHRRFFAIVIGQLCVLAFFVVMVDLVHHLVPADTHGRLVVVIGAIEDWGEMLAMSGLVWSAFAWCRALGAGSRGQPATSEHRYGAPGTTAGASSRMPWLAAKRDANTPGRS